jgi:molybdopterin-guanine dinucleotide biosynthesis protein B
MRTAMKIFGFAGWSGSGKTTLIEKLIPLFVERRLKVSLIKHAHHSFDVDEPGKDSYRHRHAGCTEVLVSSSRRWALMHELRGAPEPGFEELVRNIAPCDLLLVEGFKREKLPKLEVYRAATGEPLLHPQDPDIVGVATDRKLETRLPQFDLNDAPGIATFVVRHLGLA